MSRQQANTTFKFRRLLPSIFSFSTGLLAAMEAAGLGASDGWPFLPCLVAAMTGSALGAYFDGFAAFKVLGREFSPGERAFVGAAVGLTGFLTCFFFVHGRHDVFPVFVAGNAYLVGALPAAFGIRRLIRQGRGPVAAVPVLKVDLKRPAPPAIKPVVATNEPIYLAVLLEKSGRIDGRSFDESKSTFFRRRLIARPASPAAAVLA